MFGRRSHGLQTRVTDEALDVTRVSIRAENPTRAKSPNISAMSPSSDRPRIISPDTLRGLPRDRTPPAQVLTAKWPVLHYGGVPKVDPHHEDWSLRIFGLVDKPYDLTYDEIRAMPATDAA